ncbi:Nodulin-26 [Acrasis kona]|uniref:Nodulin-26 n=1 Tax=Acrasis kona TaxID=1008807 RepID=A0AAW2YJV6_9EUKA
MVHVNENTEVIINVPTENDALMDQRRDMTHRKHSIRGILKHIIRGPKHKPDMTRTDEKIHAEIRRGAAEFVGTFVISLTLSIIGVTHALTKEKISLPMLTAVVDGLTHAVLIYTISAVSGGHFNPTLSLAFAVKGAFTPWRLLYYWFSQFAGGILGCLLVHSVFGDAEHLGVPHPMSVTNVQALLFEVIGSFIDIMVILAVAETSYIVGTHAAIAVAFAHIVIGILFSGAAESKFNIVLAVSPVILTKTHFDTIWIYLTGPVLGAFIALLVSRIFITKRDREETVKEATGTSMLNPAEDEESDDE